MEQALQTGVEFQSIMADRPPQRKEFGQRLAVRRDKPGGSLSLLRVAI